MAALIPENKIVLESSLVSKAANHPVSNTRRPAKGLQSHVLACSGLHHDISWLLTPCTVMVVFCLSALGCHETSKVVDVADIPIRRASRGEAISIRIECREIPLGATSVPGMEDCVENRSLCDALCAALPMWHPPTVPSLLHELHVWGKDADFSADLVGQRRTGQDIIATLLSDELCKQNTVPATTDYLVDSPYGISVARSGTVGSSSYRGEGHYGQLLKVLAQAGVPSSAPVTTVSGAKGTVYDLLQDAILQYSPSEEQEFIAPALAMYLTADSSPWINQFGEEYTFDHMLESLLARDHGDGTCCGCHVPFAIATLLSINETEGIISFSNRDAARRRLLETTRLLERSQLPSGGWDQRWPGHMEAKSPYRDAVLDRITVTGHHLEWLAFAPAEVRPSHHVIKRAVSSLSRDIDLLPEFGNSRHFKILLPCSHAANALCLLRGVDPFTTWNRFHERDLLERTPKGFKMRR